MKDRFRPQDADSAHLLSFLLQFKIEQQGDSCSAAPASKMDSSQTPWLVHEFNSVPLTPLWLSLSVPTLPPSHSLVILSFCKGNYVSRDALFSPRTDRQARRKRTTILPSLHQHNYYSAPFPSQECLCGSQVARTLYGYIYIKHLALQGQGLSFIFIIKSPAHCHKKIVFCIRQS